MHASWTDWYLMESNHPDYMREAAKFRLAKLARDPAAHHLTLLERLHLRRPTEDTPTKDHPSGKKAA